MAFLRLFLFNRLKLLFKKRKKTKRTRERERETPAGSHFRSGGLPFSIHRTGFYILSLSLSLLRSLSHLVSPVPCSKASWEPRKEPETSRTISPTAAAAKQGATPLIFSYRQEPKIERERRESPIGGNASTVSLFLSLFSLSLCCWVNFYPHLIDILHGCIVNAIALCHFSSGGGSGGPPLPSLFGLSL